MKIMLVGRFLVYGNSVNDELGCKISCKQCHCSVRQLANVFTQKEEKCNTFLRLFQDIKL